jgi:hypothetical protein
MGEEGQQTELPKSVTTAFEKFFTLGVEAQDLALPLLEEATIERGRNFPDAAFQSIINGPENTVRWNDYLRGLADKLAQSMDKFYWGGHGGNQDEVTRIRNTFLHLFDNQNAQTLLQTKEQLEKVIGRKPQS